MNEPARNIFRSFFNWIFRFVHHSVVFCQLFNVCNHWKSWSQTTHSNE